MKPTRKLPQCNGKNIYSHNEAERTKAIVGKARDKDMRVYECNKCFGWHITKRKDDKLNPTQWL